MSDGWTTEDEIAFLKNIGNHADRVGNHQELLQDYKDAMPRREEWGEINPIMINAALNQLMVPRG